MNVALQDTRKTKSADGIASIGAIQTRIEIRFYFTTTIVFETT